jgi:hypothetical protein
MPNSLAGWWAGRGMGEVLVSLIPAIQSSGKPSKAVTLERLAQHPLFRTG